MFFDTYLQCLVFEFVDLLICKRLITVKVIEHVQIISEIQSPCILGKSGVLISSAMHESAKTIPLIESKDWDWSTGMFAKVLNHIPLHQIYASLHFPH